MRLNTKLEHFLLQGVSQAGTVEPEEVLIYIEEALTGDEYDLAEKFLGWLYVNKLTFGFGNIQKIFEDFQNGRKNSR